MVARSMGKVKYGGVVFAALLAMSATSLAQSDTTRAAARDLGVEGVEAYQAGRYDEANDKLNRAFDILRVPSLGLWSARALVKVGKLVEASERYLNATRLDATKGDGAVQKRAQADAAKEQEALGPRIPALTLSIVGTVKSPLVTLDGTPVQPALFGVRQPSDPGKHQIEARDGNRVVRREVTLEESQRLAVALDFANATVEGPVEPPAAVTAPPVVAPISEPPADRASTGVPAGVWVGVAVAGAGLITGGVSAGLAVKKKSDLGCPDDHCAPSQSSDVHSVNQLRTVSTIGFIVGGVGAGTAAVFWFARPKEAAQTGWVSPWVGIAAAGVRGAF